MTTSARTLLAAPVLPIALLVAASPTAMASGDDVPVAAGTGACQVTGNTKPIKVTGATPNETFTEAFRQFGNSGGGWDNQHGWAAADGTYSTELPGHQVVWLFNDTFLGPVNDDESFPESPRMVNNSAVLGGRDGLPDTTVTGGTQDDPRSLAGEKWYWNGDGIVDRGRLQVFEFEQATTDDPPPWNFGWVATDLVTFSKDFTVEKVTSIPTDGGVQWGVELLRCGGYIYIYGVESVWLDKHMHLARARAGRLTDVTSWEFYDGEGWSSDPASSARLARNVGASYSVTPVAGRYVLTTSDALLGDTVYVSIADSPMGPFDERIPVYVAPEASAGDLYAPYNIAAHPSISRPGSLTISYNVNSSKGFDGIRPNANNNRPRFLDIHLDWDE